MATGSSCGELQTSPQSRRGRISRLPRHPPRQPRDLDLPQPPGAPILFTAPGAFYTKGKRRVKVVPSCAVLATVMAPLWAWAMLAKLLNYNTNLGLVFMKSCYSAINTREVDLAEIK